jgi:hypothetical protein
MLRTATGEDWAAITGLPVPGYWIGLVYEERGTVLGLGGLFEGTDRRWWATVTSQAVRPVALWKAARQVLETAGAAGVPVYAMTDYSIPGADAFLRRLGFVETDEAIKGHRVLVWDQS